MKTETFQEAMRLHGEIQNLRDIIVSLETDQKENRRCFLVVAGKPVELTEPEQHNYLSDVIKNRTVRMNQLLEQFENL